MSNDATLGLEISEQTIAAFLQENDMDKLTDILVQSLEEAFQILQEEAKADTFH